MLPNKTQVVVKNLGDGKEYRGVVVGVSRNAFYIIQMIDQYPGNEYDCKIFVQEVVFAV